MEPIVKKFCIVGLGNVAGITTLLSDISESDVSHVTGSGLVIATFLSAFSIAEIEIVLKEEDKSYIVFEMTPGFFSASIRDKKFQDTLFGGPIDNIDFFNQIADHTHSFMEIVEEQLKGDDFILKADQPEPTSDDILDRISELGYENISDREKKLLKKYSEEK